MELHDIRMVVELAGLAPSVHNSQPWRFAWDGTALELREDRRRALPVLDPSGRELVLSCGAALFNARLALAELGRAATAELLPDGDDGEVLARLVPGGPVEVAPAEHELAVAAVRRATDRDPYDHRPVPDEVLAAMRAAAAEEGGWVHVVPTGPEKVDLQVLLAHADAAQTADALYLTELKHWRTDVGDVGIPTAALPTVPTSQRGSSLSLRDFDAGHGSAAADEADGPPVAEHPTVLVLGTDQDTRRDWLLAGAALQRVLLVGTVHGIAAQPITSVLEVPVLRERLRSALGLLGRPQMVLRAGYGTHGPASHRLPVEEVLELRGPAA